MLGSALIFLVLFSATFGGSAYNGYKVYRIKADNEILKKELAAYSNNADFDFWSDTDVMVKPKHQKGFEAFLKERSLGYSTLIKNVRGFLMKSKRKSNYALKPLSFEEYHKTEAINDYLKGLARESRKIVKLKRIGNSHEMRNIFAVQISSDGNVSKPSILIEGGMHGREWISPAAVLYLIDQLVNNDTNIDLYQDVNWYIIPVVNPDGYEYTHAKDRLWRKTRSPGTKCYGTNPNRNFRFQWGTAGASNDECHENYQGKEAHSEIEVRALASYGQKILYPWCYSEKRVEGADKLEFLAKSVANAIKAVTETSYTVGNWYKTIHPASGTSIDYVHKTLNVPLAYAIKLPDHGHAYALPPHMIQDVVEETFVGFSTLGKYVARNYS